MPAHTKPMDEINATGANKIHPARFKGRAAFNASELGELGVPPKEATHRIEKLWAEFAKEFAWLRESDRAAIFALCVVRARIEDEPDKCDAKVLKQYLDGLKAIGGAPDERSRMPKLKDDSKPDDDDDDGDSYIT